MVGRIPQERHAKTETHESAYIYAQFVAPGKHSIYIYDPDSDEFYKKVVAVDVPLQKFAHKTLPSNF